MHSILVKIILFELVIEKCKLDGEERSTMKLKAAAMSTKNFTCSAGLTGNNCSIQCRYPSFGNNCQSICNCNNSSCNAVTGCIVGSPTLYPVSNSSPVVESSHFLDNKIATPKLCPVGYLGPECEYTCRYPSYGSGCQMKCNCTEELCDLVNGCYNSSEFDEFCPCNQFEDGCRKICNCTDGIDDHISNCNVSDYKDKKWNNSYTLRIAVINIGAIDLFVLLIYICVHIRTQNEENKYQVQHVGLIINRDHLYESINVV
ncbi:protein draper isoform X2 [Magallana gigas]|uniref:protein draper isoform X2 n=1 Tax=Magallana gigas TaxID=29159 RepID=UPI003340ADA8